jgi:hypothetical protein
LSRPRQRGGSAIRSRPVRSEAGVRSARRQIVREQAGQWGHPVEAAQRLTRSGSREVAPLLTRSGSREAAPRLTRSGARAAALLKRSGSLRSSSPFGLHLEAPALPGAGEFLPWLPGAGERPPRLSGTDEFAPPLSGAAELERPLLDAPGTVLARIAPQLTAGLLGIVVMLMLVIAVAAQR